MSTKPTFDGLVKTLDPIIHGRHLATLHEMNNTLEQAHIVLRLVLMALPTNRDWLDPAVEESLQDLTDIYFGKGD